LKKLIIITGANKGLGKALFDEFLDLKEEIVLVSISRNLSDLQKKLLSEKNEKFIFISVDLDNMHNTSELTVLDAYVKIIDKVIFISNAGNIDPIGQIGQIDEQELVKSINVNVVSPSLIINYLLNVFASKKIDIVNISSGAANKVVEGWSTYCASKAYMHMFVQSLEVQYYSNNLIKVHNINPGVIDTEMQLRIRSVKNDGFIRQQEFVELKNEGKLQDAKKVAIDIIQKTKILL